MSPIYVCSGLEFIFLKSLNIKTSPTKNPAGVRLKGFINTEYFCGDPVIPVSSKVILKPIAAFHCLPEVTPVIVPIV